MMIDILGFSVLILYCLILFYISVYCGVQLHLWIQYRKRHSGKSSEGAPSDRKQEMPSPLPFVTIQLPIFNEQYVVRRLIQKVAEIEYPADRFEIQVLDDSTDNTTDIIAGEVEKYQLRGLNIEHIHRRHRKGYKAGALKEGMEVAKGEFIAIFDADFLPQSNFLVKTIPYFQQPEIGVVQSRWTHINENYSLLTRLQAFQLNVHFSVEQTGRAFGNYLLQFNGTGGIWRKETIESAGGWQSDTLTEDLDLSYRAQLNGWKIQYLENLDSPAELPAEMNGLKSQQYRWMKGGAETAKKLLPLILSSKLSPWKKLHAFSHLLASSIFVFIFLAATLSVPVAFFIQYKGWDPAFLSIFLFATLSIIVVYYTANVSSPFIGKGQSPKNIFEFCWMFPVFLSLSMGLSLHNSLAVIHGFSGKKTAFVRTPKFDIQKLGDHFGTKKYLASRVQLSTFLEILLALFFVATIYLSIRLEYYDFLPFHILLGLGFMGIAYYSLKHVSLKK